MLLPASPAVYAAAAALIITPLLLMLRMPDEKSGSNNKIKLSPSAEKTIQRLIRAEEKSIDKN